MHPLFSSWAGSSLEMQTQLVGCSETAQHSPHIVLPHHPVLSFLQHPQEVSEVRWCQGPKFIPYTSLSKHFEDCT